MSVQIALPDELVQQIDNVADDRAEFVTAAVRDKLRHRDEVAQINAIADKLNAEQEDVLGYQVMP